MATQVSIHMFGTLGKTACRLRNACYYTCLMLTTLFLVDNLAQKERQHVTFVERRCNTKSKAQVNFNQTIRLPFLMHHCPGVLICYQTSDNTIG